MTKSISCKNVDLYKNLEFISDLLYFAYTDLLYVIEELVGSKKESARNCSTAKAVKMAFNTSAKKTAQTMQKAVKASKPIFDEAYAPVYLPQNFGVVSCNAKCSKTKKKGK